MLKVTQSGWCWHDRTHCLDILKTKIHCDESGKDLLGSSNDSKGRQQLFVAFFFKGKKEKRIKKYQMKTVSKSLCLKRL